MPGGPKDKALLGRKGQDSGRGYVDFLPGGGGGRRTRVECPATPPWGESGRNLRAHGAKGTGTQTLGLGHRTGEGGHRWHSRDSGLDAVLCDIQSSQRRSRKKEAPGGLRHVAGKGRGPVPWAVASPSSANRKGLGCESVKAMEPSTGRAVRSFQGLGWLRGSNVG